MIRKKQLPAATIKCRFCSKGHEFGKECAICNCALDLARSDPQAYDRIGRYADLERAKENEILPA